MPLVSVIIPTLGRAQLLNRSVKSALAQTMTDLEVIVFIDRPSPEAMAVLSTIKDERLRVITHKTPLLAHAARNVAAEAASGEWVAFLDDDDEWMPEKLERQLAVASSYNEPIVIYSLSYISTQLTRYVWPRRLYDNTISMDEYLFDRRSLFLGDTYLQTSSLLLRRGLFYSLKFNYEHDDWDFVLRVVNDRHIKVVTVPEPLVTVYTEEARETASTTFPWRTSLSWIEKNRSLIGPRAYSGFCLTVVGPWAAKDREYSVFPKLLSQAFRFGSPRPMQVALYLAFWVLPFGWRRQVRGFWHRISYRKFHSLA
jgi:glycosyltransferase involved in cell wall biosynthesis